MATERPYRVIISGGGTGGHVYPAIAIANAMKDMYPDTEFMFVGAKGKMEMEKVPSAGYPIEGLWISGLQRKISLSNLSFPLKVISSLLRSRKIVDNFKPDVVVGVGGYASGPVLKVATGKKIPTLIQEQNSYAGLTNKMLGKKVNSVCVAYDGMEKYFPKEKIHLTGNPVRKDILNLQDKRDRAIQFFNLDPDKKTILAVGGSLGARTINESLLINLQDLIDADVQLIWQIGKFYIEEFQDHLSVFNTGGIRPYEFLNEMDLAYAASDVVISRAGALSISELSLAGKPSIFVPSPNVAEDHQTKNAKALVEKDAALLVPDQEARERLIPEALKLLMDDPTKTRLAENIKKLGKPNAAEDIVSQLMTLVK